MSDPVITPAILAVYLNDPTIDVTRATQMIARAQALCESVISPLPDGAEVVVERVAGRAYVSTVTTRTAQLIAAGSQIGGQPMGTGGVYLTRADRADLRRAAGGGTAFTINLLPSTYTYTLPIYDVNTQTPTFETS
jgi:hypothetical protein